MARSWFALGKSVWHEWDLQDLYDLWANRPPGFLTSVQEKWEASSEVLMDDGRQVGHDQEEDGDQAGRHQQAVYPDP